MIAKLRGISGGKMFTIALLSWFGIFFGLTWVVALILSLLWGYDTTDDPDNLDKLEKLARLHKQGAITKKEFESMKAKLLG